MADAQTSQNTVGHYSDAFERAAAFVQRHQEAQRLSEEQKLTLVRLYKVSKEPDCRETPSSLKGLAWRSAAELFSAAEARKRYVARVSEWCPSFGQAREPWGPANETEAKSAANETEAKSAAEQNDQSRDYKSRECKSAQEEELKTGISNRRGVTLFGIHWSIGDTWSDRVQTLAVASASLFGFSWMLFGSLTLSMIFLWVSITTPLMLSYLVYIAAVDTSAVDGKRAPILRGLYWWRYFAEYFPITLVKTADLNPQRNYVFGMHPHGVISVSAFACFATDGVHTLDLTTSATASAPLAQSVGVWRRFRQRVRAAVGQKPSSLTSLDAFDEPRGFSHLFPGIQRRLLTLRINFWAPFMREYLLWLGICDARKETFRTVLGSGPGQSVVVVVGGAEEAVETKVGALDLVLEKRKGFVREAILANADLVPVLSFGENDLYHTLVFEKGSRMRQVQDKLRKTLTFSTPLFSGRGLANLDFGLLPLRTPVVVVVGPPIPAPDLPEDERRNFAPRTNAEHAKILNTLHRRYIDELKRLYERCKDEDWNGPGVNRHSSLTIH